MGRAIVRNPKVFLFDEPLSNLDAKLRVQMRTEIKRVHQKVRTTTVYVTHDQVEAMTLADRVVVMNRGSIEQIGTPQRSLSCAGDALRRRLHRLAGDELHALPAGGGGRRLERAADRRARAAGAAVACRALPRSRRPQGADFGLRPEHITEMQAATGAGKRLFDAMLEVTEPMGMETLVYLPRQRAQVCGRVSPNAGAREGAPMRLAASLNNMHLIDDATGRVI